MKDSTSDKIPTIDVFYSVAGKINIIGDEDARDKLRPWILGNPVDFVNPMNEMVRKAMELGVRVVEMKVEKIY